MFRVKFYNFRHFTILDFLTVMNGVYADAFCANIVPWKVKVRSGTMLGIIVL